MVKDGDVPRVPAGRPEGGEFAPRVHRESDVYLTADHHTHEGDWPPVRFERRNWELSPHTVVPLRERVHYLGPYEAAVTPPIADLTLAAIPDGVLALAAEAATEIARYDADAVHVAPFESLLLRSESAASSQIEQLTASAKAIALAELGDTSRRNAAAIVANTKAMRAAIDLADRVDEHAILDMHAALLGGTHPHFTGRWRDEQVWIGGGPYGPHGASFVPPHHDRVPDAMRDLVMFMARNDLPPLVQASLAHAQFETIHPFPDGNGRTGRALVHSLLRGKGLTRTVTVPVSAGLLVDTGAYFDALGDYRRGEPATIVELMATASFAAIGNGRQLTATLEQLRTRWAAQISARRGAAVRRLADMVLRQPVIDSPTAQRELGLSAPAVNNGIDQLAAAGVLRKVSGKQRNRKWAAPEVLEALDAFAARAGRRTSPSR